MNVVIHFTADGAGHCLYTDIIPLQEIGRLHLRRASHVEFDEATQVWRVIDASSNQELYQNASRQLCLDWERDNLMPSITP